MKITQKFIVILCINVCLSYGFLSPVRAEAPYEEQTVSKLKVFQKFLKNAKENLKDAEVLWEEKQSNLISQNILPEGEVLLLTVRLPRRVTLEGVIFGQSRNKKIVISLKDFGDVLNFPINVQAEDAQASGWYLRENKTFALDLKNRTAKTDNGTFNISDDVFVEDEDIFVPASELAQWINFDIEPMVSKQELLIEPSDPLPSQEKAKRHAKRHLGKKPSPPLLPEKIFPRQLIDIPTIDVTSNLSYKKDGGTKDTNAELNGSIATVGDLAYGTFATRSQYDDTNGIRSLRAKYSQASQNPDLLGKLNARRYELGDVTTVSLPLANSAGQDLGFRITNKDPLSSLTNPTSVISGTTFPEWDVELYRGNQFVDFQTVDEEGFFSFNNVGLFSQDNEFKLIFYGPQGEIREEDISIPVDTQRLSDKSGVYDVSVTLEDEQTYLKDRSNRDEDSGSANVIGLYELPLGGSTAGSVGFRSNQVEDNRNYVAQTGFSTGFAGSLLNFNIALDDEVESNAELVMRRSFGQNNINSTTSWIDGGFDSIGGEGKNSVGVFRQNISAVGPLPFLENLKPKYSARGDFSETTDGNTNFIANAGINAQWEGLTFNEQINYLTADTLAEDQVTSFTTLSGVYKKNRIRTVFNYEVKPERTLNSVVAGLTHKVSKTLDVRMGVDKKFEPALTEGSLSVNWQAGFARLSPRVEYNSDNDFFVGLNTRFSIFRDPIMNKFQTLDRSITGSGGFSALVYLDENGNQKFDENEQPIEGVTVSALQNGGNKTTDENGIALFTNMAELKLTDVVLEERSLPDPLWIPGFEGISVVPRKGHYATAEFPVHNAGEMDGILYGRTAQGDSKQPLKNVGLSLYDLNGKLQDTAVTDMGGFYFFSRIPPGTYYLLVNERNAKRDNFARPLPKKVEIGYDGTLIFGNDIYVELDKKDVPSSIVKGYTAFKERHPHVAFDNFEHSVVLNLGEYNSQTLMALVWYKLRKEHARLIKDTNLYVAPNQSYADPRTGKHTLRVGLNSGGIEGAYNRCRTLLDNDIFCKVEILPKGKYLVNSG